MRLVPTFAEARRIAYDLLTLALIVLVGFLLWTGWKSYWTLRNLDLIVGYAIQSGQITLPQAPPAPPTVPETSPEAPPGPPQ